MANSERLISLSPEEIEKVKGGKTGCTGCFVIVVVLTIIGAGLSFFIFGGPVNLGYAPFYLTPVIAAGIIVLAYFIAKSNKRKAERDLSAGQKKVLTGPVTKQYMKSWETSRRRGSSVTLMYYIDIGGKSYRLSEGDYYKYKEGMMVEVHTAPNSETFLGIYDASDGKLLTSDLE